jgi:O-glycosyl hydrolase
VKKKIRTFLLFNLISVFQLISQNQLPIQNGEMEATENGFFSNWQTQANNGGNAIFSISTDNLIPGSTKALKSEVISLGDNNYDISTSSQYNFEVIAGQKYTISFYAKIEGASSRQLKVVFRSEIDDSFQGQNIWVTDTWQRYTHTFTVDDSANANQLKFWFLNDGVTYYLDEVSVIPGNYVNITPMNAHQTIDGFGAGIKRRTEDLYELDDNLRNQIEAYCFQDLEVNMIRFFVYHDLEPSNDNNDPYLLDDTQLDWTRYDSDPNQSRTRYVAEALQNAFSLSNNGFDHVIGNCNSAPGWLKTNGQHNNGGTLIPGGEPEYSEFLIAFLEGMKSRYNIDVTAISPTNEPDYEVTYESMNTTPSQLSSIILNLNGRLTSAQLDHVKIISPECFRVENSNNNSNSTTNYINNMFTSPAVEAAIDIVATHTYADAQHNANWNGLKLAAQNKPVWVTESANLNSTDQSMTDAANYIKWMLRGFNEGGMTAYMMHLFYEEADTSGYSSLVAWNTNGTIILPKRYHTFKHFSNLIKKGYRVIDSQTIEGDIMVGSFISPDQSKIVLQLFNEGEDQNFSIDVPVGATNISHYVTSNSGSDNFSLYNDVSFELGSRYTNLSIPSMSLHTLVYSIDSSVLSTNTIEKSYEFENLVIAYPNPTINNIKLKFLVKDQYLISLFYPNGIKIYETLVSNKKIYDLKTSGLSDGVYLVKIQSKTKSSYTVVKLIKK